MQIAYIPRADFLNGGFDYEPGEHVAFFEPTQQGKTHLAYQMLQSAMAQHPELRYASLMPKSRDPATRRWAEAIGMPVIDRWPPPARFPWQEKPPGHVLWPRHPKNVTVRERRDYVGGVIRTGLHDQFEKGDSVTLIDDVLLCSLLGLNPEMEEHLSAGGGGGAALWLTNQKTSGTKEAAVTTLAYSAPVHILLGHDPIGENRRRFSDIGGVEPGMVARVVAGLRKHRIKTAAGYKNISEKLYIRKDGPYMAIIGP